MRRNCKKSLALAACAITTTCTAKTSNGYRHTFQCSDKHCPKLALVHTTEGDDANARTNPQNVVFSLRGGSQRDKKGKGDGSRGAKTSSSSGKKKRRRRKSKKSADHGHGHDHDDDDKQSNETEDSIRGEDIASPPGVDPKAPPPPPPPPPTHSEKSQSQTEIRSESQSNRNTAKTKTPPPPPPPPLPKEEEAKSKPESFPQTSSSSNYQKQTKKQKPKPTQTSKSNDKDDIIQQIITTQCLYQILDLHNLSKSQKSSLTSIQITKAYRRRAVLTHPDKLNGDRCAFDKVSEAYDILGDEQKKKIYDRFGLEAVKDPDFAARSSMGGSMGGGGGLGGSFQEQIFKSFFGATGAGGPGGGFSSRMSQQFRKNEDLKYELEVSLEDMYSGSRRNVPISQPNGRRVVEVDIPPGIVSGSSILLSGMVDHVPNATPGDVVFVVRQKKHEKFNRKGYDLAMELKISLSEAICGFERTIEHLDGRQINVRMGMGLEGGRGGTKKKETPIMIKTGDVHVLKGEGMPKRQMHGGHGAAWEDHDDMDRRRERFGDLYVQYRVDMPRARGENIEKLSEEERETLGRLLDKLQGVERVQISENDSQGGIGHIHELERAHASGFGQASADDDTFDDEDEHGHLGGEDEQEHFSPGFQFFSSSSGGRRSHQFFSRGASPFTSSSSYHGADEGDVQCQQM